MLYIGDTSYHAIQASYGRLHFDIVELIVFDSKIEDLGLNCISDCRTKLSNFV